MMWTTGAAPALAHQQAISTTALARVLTGWKAPIRPAPYERFDMIEIGIALSSVYGDTPNPDVPWSW
jgi:hypothetical protein